jgi:hypothetical protein
MRAPVPFRARAPLLPRAARCAKELWIVCGGAGRRSAPFGAPGPAQTPSPRRPHPTPDRPRRAGRCQQPAQAERSAGPAHPALAASAARLPSGRGPHGSSSQPRARNHASAAGRAAAAPARRGPTRDAATGRTLSGGWTNSGKGPAGPLRLPPGGARALDGAPGAQVCGPTLACARPGPKPIACIPWASKQGGRAGGSKPPAGPPRWPEQQCTISRSDAWPPTNACALTPPQPPALSLCLLGRARARQARRATREAAAAASAPCEMRRPGVSVPCAQCTKERETAHNSHPSLAAPARASQQHNQQVASRLAAGPWPGPQATCPPAGRRPYHAAPRPPARANLRPSAPSAPIRAMSGTRPRLRLFGAIHCFWTRCRVRAAAAPRGPLSPPPRSSAPCIAPASGRGRPARVYRRAAWRGGRPLPPPRLAESVAILYQEPPPSTRVKQDGHGALHRTHWPFGRRRRGARRRAAKPRPGLIVLQSHGETYF